MSHGVVEIFAYQETLLIMAVFGVALLTMIWVGFSRWLRQKERMDRLIADQTAERTAQLSGQIERVEARLNAIEHGETAAQIDALAPNSPSKHGETAPSP